MLINSKYNMLLGKKIKELREQQGLLQRQLAASLEIDTPMYSKIERGDRRAKREQVMLLSGLLGVDDEVLLSIWIADQIIDAVGEERRYVRSALEIAQDYLLNRDNTFK
jgi:transcriptional regulator with XRE-family HTH domain